MYRYSIIVAFMAAATVQGGPLNVISRLSDSVVGDTGVGAVITSEGSANSMENAKRSEEGLIAGDIDVGTVARDDGRIVKVENSKRSDGNDGINKLSNDKRDEQLIGPFDIDGILPVGASGVIADI